MASLVQYYASVGIKVDEKALKQVDAYLKKIEQRIAKAGGNKGLRINAYVDEAKLTKHLQTIFSKLGKGLPLKLSNVTADPVSLSKSIREHLAKATFRAPITAVLNRASLATVRQQLQAALVGINISPRVSSASVSGGARSPGTAAPRGSVAASRRASLTGRGDPSLQEFIGGTYSRSSLTAGNRRFVDAIMQRGLGGVGGQGTLTNMAVEGGLGALGRSGASTTVGRVAGMVGLRAFGPVGGALALTGGGVVGKLFEGVGLIWSTLGKVITTPFSLIGSAASTVTSAFYRVALAAVPLVAGFGFINRKVQEGSQRSIALNTVATSLGSSGQAEQKFLMDMSNREGMRFDTLVQPYTSFIASASPAMGLDMAKNVFEAFTQFGLTRGAGDVSMGLAMKAVSQMAGKGRVQAEELRGQLGDAPGFGEMQGIFAEAYQMSLGRSPADTKKGQQAIEELNKAMEKGQVISAKILPHVAEIAKRMAEPGLAEARTASFAEQNRFSNQMTDGWKLFREGGGEEGIAHFWRMMQGFGQWWKDNSTQLGMYFKSVILYLDAFQESIKELFHFAATGESTSITEMFKRSGLDVDAIRESFVKLKDSILKLLGLGEGQDGLKVLSERLIVFANDLVLVVDAIRQIVDGVSDLKGYVFQPRKAPEEQFKDSVGNFGKEVVRLSPFGRLFNYDTDKADTGVGKIASGVVGGSIDIFKGLRNLAIGSNGQGLYQPPPQNNYPPISLPPVQENIPRIGPIDPASITGGTRRSDFVTSEDVVRGIFGGKGDAASALKGSALGSSPGGTFQPPILNNDISISLHPVQSLYQPPKQNNYIPISLPPLQGNIPSLGPIDPSTITGGTRARDFTTHKVDVTLKVEGNQEAIGLLIDSKVREGFPLMLTNEITKSMTAAPIR